MRIVKDAVLKNLIAQIAPYAETDALVIDEWSSYTGIHRTAGNVVLDGGKPTTMRLGDRWNVGYDDTRYFEASVVIPQNMDGKKIYLKIDFGGEALVRINGRIVGAVSSRENSGWVSRTEILFNEPAEAGAVLNVQVENAVDSGGFCDFAMAGSKFMTYTMKEAKLFAVNEECESYLFDITAVYEAYERTDDEYVKPRLYAAADASARELEFDMGKERFLASVPAAKKKLRDMIGEIKYSSPGEVIMAGHSHLDVAWLWTVKEINRKTARTFANVLALMDKYPDFKFTQSQAVLYDFMKRNYPEIYERIKEKVKNGQWEIVGNAWVEADANIASGESLVRQLLYGREFFIREFGVDSDVYWLPDCFGFTWALPQIIGRSGMKYFMTSKLSNNDSNPFPLSVFKWRAHSGDEIIAYMQKVHYEGEYDPAYIVDCRKRNLQNDIVDVSLGTYGYGDGGGGCTYQMYEKGDRLANMPGLPASRRGFVSDFFKKIEKKRDELPVWDGEMYYENHRGTYTSQAFVKKNNRQIEFLLRNAEILSVFAGGEYPDDALDEAWKLLLTNQFHDVLPGTSIKEVFDNCRLEYAKAREICGGVIDSALEKLNSRIKLDGDGAAVWNLLPWSADGPVEIEVPPDVRGATDCDGKPVPCTVKKVNGKNILSFIAKNVPAAGYRVFKTTARDVENPPCVKAEKNLLENEFLRVELDENGLIDKIYDKKANGRQILAGKGNLLTISRDKPVHESAWNLEFDYRKNTRPLIKAESVEILESSPVRGAARVVRRFNESTITQDIVLEAGKPTLDFNTTVDWREREKVLKAEFPVDIRSVSAAYETAHGATERPTHYNTSYDFAKFECCAHKWADLSEGGYGVGLLNDCKYGYDIHGNRMRITLMRGPVCPDPTADMGISEFRYSLYPHSGGWRDSDVVKLAFLENVGLTPSYLRKNGGDLTRSFSFLCVNRDNIIIDAIKKARDGSGIIIRVYESETRNTDVVLSLRLPFNRVVECNLMEVEEKEIECSSGAFAFHIKPHEVKTFKLVP